MFSLVRAYQNGNTGAQQSSKQLPAYVNKLNTALHACVILLSLSIAFALFDNTLFGWHPLFMSLGYVLFMSEGIIAAVMFRHLDGPERVRAIQSHALLQLRAILCIAVGFGVIYRNKVIHGKSHFLTTHAKCGLASLILSALSPIWGLVSFRKMGIIQKFPERLQPTIKMLHRQVGVLTWLLAMATIMLALPHPAVYKGMLTTVWQAGVVCTVLGMLVLIAKARVKSKEDDLFSKAV